MTTEYLPTFGALFILDGGSFDVLLGMPWLEKNLGSVIAREQGTFVGWRSEGREYEVLASMLTALPVRVRTTFVEEYVDESDKDESRGAVTVCMARVSKTPTIDQFYVPDSEEDRQGPEYLEISSGEDESGQDTVNWARNQVRGWMGQNAEEPEYVPSSGEEDPDGEVRENQLGTSTPPPNQLAQGSPRTESPEEEEVRETTKRRRKRTHTGNLEEEVIEVSREIKDELTKMSQKEVDEGEWDRFWVREGTRITRRDKEWLRWIQSSDKDEEEAPARAKTPESIVVEEASSKSESVTMDCEPGTQARSQTIGTYPEEPERSTKKPRLTRRILRSTEVVARRSTQERHLTAKGKLFADEILKKQRKAYQR